MSADHTIDIDYVAKLARIDIDPDKHEKLQAEMSQIVAYIEQLDELDVSGIEPTAHAAAMTNVWREDTAGETYPRDVMLANAPAVVEEELVKVPQVLPGEEGA